MPIGGNLSMGSDFSLPMPSSIGGEVWNILGRNVRCSLTFSGSKTLLTVFSVGFANCSGAASACASEGFGFSGEAPATLSEVGKCRALD